MKNKRGFTLIELLIVISIITLLSSIIMASMVTAKERARIAGGQKFNASLFNVIGANTSGYWNFDEGTGSVFGDLTNQHNGTAGGTPIPAWTADTGMTRGSALLFSGTAHLVTAGTVSTPSPHITISAWIKTTNAGDQVVFSLRGGGNIFFGTSGGKFYVFVNNSNVPTMLSSATVNDGKWHHVAWTSDGAKSIMYVDGRTDTTLSRTTTAVPAVTAYIARDAEFGATFAGVIDEVAMYNQTMIASELSKMYLAGREKYID